MPGLNSFSGLRRAPQPRFIAVSRTARRVAACVLPLLLLAVAACDDDTATGPGASVAAVTIEPDSVAVAVGGSRRLSAVARDAEGNVLEGVEVTWASGDTSVVEVDSTGLAVGIAEGAASVRAGAQGRIAAATVIVTLLDPEKYEMRVVEGDGQSGLAGTVLSQPLVARVQRRSDAAPAVGVRVDWRVREGAAEVTRRSAVTDEDGRAAVRLQFGEATGTVRVEAAASGLIPATFDLTALRVPELESISPTSVAPGDTVDVGLNVPPDPAMELLFDGVAGVVVGDTKEPPVLQAVVPAPAGACGPTVDVDVRLHLGGLTTAPLPLTVAVPAEPFQVGQVLRIEESGDAGCAALPAAAGTAKYLLAVLSTEFQTFGQFEVTLSADRVSVAPAPTTATPVTEDFHARLRRLEGDIASHGVTIGAGLGAAAAVEPQLGSEREFWVVDTTSLVTPLTEEQFERVTGRLAYRGVHTLVYLDERGGLQPDDIELLGSVYDQYLYEAAVDFFGEPSDVDDNNKVIVLLTPTVNSLGSPGIEAITVGYSFGLDLLDPNAVGCSDCRFSNGGEVFYGIVSDPEGVFTDPVSRERALELLLPTMVHETQHMISLAVRLFRQGGRELLWLSEALAHAAEEVGGDALFHARELPLAEDMYLANLDRAWRYLQEPNEHSLTAVIGGGRLAERGAAWLFLRWIAERYGDFIMRDLTQTSAIGVANVEARTGEPFFRLFADWAITLWTDDLSIPNLPERYQIPKWNLRELEVGDPPVYALQPLETTFAELEATPIQSFMAATSPLYVIVDAAGATADLQLQLDAMAGAGLAIVRLE